MIINSKEVIESIRWLSSHWFIEEREGFLSDFIFNAIHIGSFMPIDKEASENKTLADFIVEFNKEECDFFVFINKFLESEIKRALLYIMENYNDKPHFLEELKGPLEKKDFAEVVIGFIEEEYPYEFETVLMEPIRRDYITEMRLIGYDIIKNYHNKNKTEIKKEILSLL